MIVGKLVGGVTAIGVAMMIAPKTSAPLVATTEESVEAEAN